MPFKDDIVCYKVRICVTPSVRLNARNVSPTLSLVGVVLGEIPLASNSYRSESAGRY